MKRTAAAWTAAGLMALATAAVGFGLRATGRPEMELSPKAIELGTLLQNVKVDGKVQVTNSGRRPLEVTSIKGSCKCLTVMQDRLSIPPGQSKEVNYAFDSLNYRGDTKLTLFLASNDPHRPKATVRLHANVEHDYLVEPASINFGKVPWNATRKAYIRLDKPSGPTAAIAKVALDRNAFSASVTKTPDSPDDPDVITVEYGGSKTTGPIDSSLTIEISTAPPRTFTVPIHIEVTGDVECIPDRIFLGVVEPGKTYTKRLSIRSAGGEPLEVMSIEASDAQSVTWREAAQTPERLDLEVSVVAREKGPAPSLRIARKSDVCQLLQIPIVYTPAAGSPASPLASVRQPEKN